MALIFNILWLLFGGLAMALNWLLAAALMAITIIGLPWAPAALRIAGYTLLPFGQTVVANPEAGAFSFVGNVLWVVLAGWWLALAHVALGIACAVTIIGIPFAWAHFKLARASLAPVGKMIIPAP